MMSVCFPECFGPVRTFRWDFLSSNLTVNVFGRLVVRGERRRNVEGN